MQRTVDSTKRRNSFTWSKGRQSPLCGISQEALFALGFTTTLELSISMQESEIRSLLEEKFKNKLESISRKGNKFQFVRAINSKIISLENTNQQECQAPCDGRLLKHISGQGPLYIRANEDIGAPLQAYNSKQKRHDKDDNTDDEMESESSTGDEEAIMRNTMYKPCPTPIVRVDLSILDDAAAPDEDSVPNCDPLPATGESSTSVPSTSTALAPEQLIRVRCPTCEGSFSSHEIEDHADVCAEAAWTGSEHLVYARLMADIENDDQDPLENQSAAEENNSYPIDQQDNWDHTTNDGSQAEIKAELIGTLQTLQTNLNTRTNRINVQRTSVLDDYIDARKRFHWMHPENRIKVVFIGEPAIDMVAQNVTFVLVSKFYKNHILISKSIWICQMWEIFIFVKQKVLACEWYEIRGGGLKYGFMKYGGIHAEGTEQFLSTCNQVHVKPGVDLPGAGKGVHPCWPWSIVVRKFRSETGKIRLPYLGYVDTFQRCALWKSLSWCHTTPCSYF